MNAGRTVFSQLMDFLPLAEFRRCVEHYRGDYKVQRFSSLDPFLGLTFAQLTFRESLRDIETCLRTQQSKLYHRGLRGFNKERHNRAAGLCHEMRGSRCSQGWHPTKRERRLGGSMRVVIRHSVQRGWQVALAAILAISLFILWLPRSRCGQNASGPPSQISP